MKAFLSHIKLLGMGKTLEGFKQREHLICFGFQEDYSRHSTENGLGGNGAWEVEEIIQVTVDGDLL